MKVFHDPMAQETIIEYDERFLFFDLPIQIQKVIISNFFSPQTRARFTQTSKQAKLLCDNLTYDYPFNTTSPQRFFTHQYELLNKKINALDVAIKTLKNYKKLSHPQRICTNGLVITIICSLSCSGLSIALSFTVLKNINDAFYLILAGICASFLFIFTPIANFVLYKEVWEPTYKQNRVKKLDNEIHLVKLSLIQEFGKEPRLKKRAEPILKTMNFKA